MDKSQVKSVRSLEVKGMGIIGVEEIANKEAYTIHNTLFSGRNIS
jgi:hypothetical protein